MSRGQVLYHRGRIVFLHLRLSDDVTAVWKAPHCHSPFHTRPHTPLAKALRRPARGTACSASSGRYCPSGSIFPPGSQCPAGYHCLGGTGDKQACSAFLLPARSSSAAGSPGGASDMQPCPMGPYSPYWRRFLDCKKYRRIQHDKVPTGTLLCVTCTQCPAGHNPC